MEIDDPAQAGPAFWQRAAGGFLRLINPMVRRMVTAGVPTGAENILLTTRGRRSGEPRTVPVGMLELEGRRFVQASYGEGGWVGNLRAAGEATITAGTHLEPVEAVELPPDQAAAILQRALESYPRSRVLRAFLGRFRPPIGVLMALHRRVDDTLEEYLEDARRHPLFELRRTTRTPG
jgi:deazaflavin-dependent oxidoreductase (nitroreductase family)